MPYMDQEGGGTYIGVPQDYKVTTGYRPTIVQGYEDAVPHGSMTNVALPPVYNAPINKKPIYTMSDLSNLYGKDPSQVTATQMMLYNSGYLSAGGFKVGIYDTATYDALGDAMTDANSNGLTLAELYDTIRQGAKNGQGIPFGGSSGSGADYSPYTDTATSTSTNEQVNLTGRGYARGILITALEAEMGREATPKEVTRFLRSLNAAERAHPTTSTTKTKTVTTTDPSKSGDSTTTSDSDSSTTTKQSKVDPISKAENFAETVAPQEASRFQGAGFMDVIAQMLGM